MERDLQQRMNKKIVLASYPDETFPDNLSAFQPTIEKIRPLKEGQVLIQVLYLSIDPVARVWVSGAKSYLPALKPGMEIPSFGIGQVQYSLSSMYSPNDLVGGVFSWSTFVIRKAKELVPIPADVLQTYRYLSIFGPTGITAYQAIKEQMAQLPKDAAIVISSAAGATGIAFCQYARVLGFTRIVGIAGSDEKCRFVREKLGCRASVNYKTQSIGDDKVEVSSAIQQIFPEGVDLYFDNIGEEMLQQMLLCMKNHSKVILCGATATYARWKSKSGISTLLQAIVKRITLKGIIYFGQYDKMAESLPQMIELVDKHNLLGYETLLKGIESAPLGLRGVYRGQYTGKTIIDLTTQLQAKL